MISFQRECLIQYPTSVRAWRRRTWSYPAPLPALYTEGPPVGGPHPSPITTHLPSWSRHPNPWYPQTLPPGSRTSVLYHAPPIGVGFIVYRLHIRTSPILKSAPKPLLSTDSPSRITDISSIPRASNRGKFYSLQVIFTNITYSQVGTQTAGIHRFPLQDYWHQFYTTRLQQG